MRGWANGWCVVAQAAILNLYLQKVGGQEAELETPSALGECVYEALPEGVVLPTEKNAFCWWIKSYAGRLYSQTKSNVFGEQLNKLVKGIWSIPNPPEQEEGEEGDSAAASSYSVTANVVGSKVAKFPHN